MLGTDGVLITRGALTRPRSVKPCRGSRCRRLHPLNIVVVSWDTFIGLIAALGIAAIVIVVLVDRACDSGPPAVAGDQRILFSVHRTRVLRARARCRVSPGNGPRRHDPSGVARRRFAVSPARHANLSPIDGGCCPPKRRSSSAVPSRACVSIRGSNVGARTVTRCVGRSRVSAMTARGRCSQPRPPWVEPSGHRMAARVRTRRDRRRPRRQRGPLAASRRALIEIRAVVRRAGASAHADRPGVDPAAPPRLTAGQVRPIARLPVASSGGMRCTSAR
jgi:hypothetical protein